MDTWDLQLHREDDKVHHFALHGVFHILYTFPSRADKPLRTINRRTYLELLEIAPDPASVLPRPSHKAYDLSLTMFNRTQIRRQQSLVCGERGTRESLRFLVDSLEALRLADSTLVSAAKDMGWIGSGMLTYARQEDNIMMEGAVLPSGSGGVLGNHACNSRIALKDSHSAVKGSIVV